jgi:hypothetical protein
MWLKMNGLKETGGRCESVCVRTYRSLQREFDDITWGSEGKDACYLSKPRRLAAKPQEGDRKLLRYIAQKIARTRTRRTEASN